MITEDQVKQIQAEVVKCWAGNPLVCLAHDAIVHTVCSMLTAMTAEISSCLKDTVNDPDYVAGFSAVRYHLADICSPLQLVETANIRELEEELTNAVSVHRIKLMKPRYMSRFEYHNGAVYLAALEPKKRKKTND